MSDGQVIFEIKGDNTNVKQSLKDTTQAIQDESKKWDSSVDDSSGNISESLIGAFSKVAMSAAFVKIAQMLMQLGAEGIQVASDLEEVQNVVDVTFGESGAKKIEKWSKEAAANFGLTELQAKKYSSTLGAMMKSSGMGEDQIADMSMQLAGLAADMASFYNLDFDTAFSKIQSGMAGMSMPLRQLGINMTEASLSAYAMEAGFDTAYDKMTETEQMIVRYGYIMKATGDAQGDFARTSDSFANSQRRVATGIETLKAQIGEALLPIATEVSNAITDLLDILVYTPPENVFDKASESMADAAGQATQAQGILGYMDKLVEKYGAAAKDTDEWAGALERLKDVFPDVNKFIDEETGALTATNEQLKKYVENSKKAAIEDAKKAAIAELNERYVTAQKDYYTAEVKRDIASEEASAARSSLVSYIQSKPGQEGFEDTGFLTMDQLSWIAKDLANKSGETHDAINEWVRIFNEQSKEADKQSKEMDKLSGTITSTEADLAIANEALARLSAAAGEAASAMESMGGADGSHASGLNYVPFDGYRAILHKGERVLTATEANIYRTTSLQPPSMDMGALINGLGGNVYLDGRVVGQVISQMQGDQFRNMKRSGFRQ